MGLTAMGVISKGLTETAVGGGVQQQRLWMMEVWWLTIDSFPKALITLENIQIRRYA